MVDLEGGLALAEDKSFARIRLTTESEDGLRSVVGSLQQFGVNSESVEDAELATAEVDGAMPKGFYSTTNLGTEVRVHGRWVGVERPEMDCGVVVASAGPARSRWPRSRAACRS